MGDRTQTIHVITPRLVLRTRFTGGHEQLGVYYMNMFYGDNVAAARPLRAPGGIGQSVGGNGDVGNPAGFDEHVLALFATIWW